MEGIRSCPGLGMVDGCEEGEEGLCANMSITGLEPCARALKNLPLSLLIPESGVETKGNRTNIGRIKIV